MLDNEMFHSIKPGLSAYVDVPETVSSAFPLISCIELEGALIQTFPLPEMKVSEKCEMTTKSGPADITLSVISALSSHSVVSRLFGCSAVIVASV